VVSRASTTGYLVSEALEDTKLILSKPWSRAVPERCTESIEVALEGTEHRRHKTIKQLLCKPTCTFLNVPMEVTTQGAQRI